jgi:enamine deaminase RidA (YjgF/YER057c/UK114 family)
MPLESRLTAEPLMSPVEFIGSQPHTERSALSSDVVLLDGWAFLSGVSPVDLNDDHVPLPELVEDQARKIFANLELLLGKVGMTKQEVFAVRIHLTDFKRFFDRVNAVYAGFFEPDRLPSRTCVGVTHLTRGALVEMDFVARKASAADLTFLPALPRVRRRNVKSKAALES